MRVSVAVVGRPRERCWAELIRDYEARAARYWPLDVHEVREEAARGNSPDLVRRKEGDRLVSTLPPGSHIVVCDLGGTRMTSEEFSAWLQRHREGQRDVSFLIGGAYGLNDDLKTQAASRLSLASWTMTHEMARLVLAEQLYRAGTIVRGEPYHK